jgi:hypothetical protein
MATSGVLKAARVVFDAVLLLEALNRHRGKQQKVTVEHVQVHSGGASDSR